MEQIMQSVESNTGVIDGHVVPIVDVDESETLPVGLYRLARIDYPVNVFDLSTKHWHMTGSGELLLRIDHGIDLPCGVEMARIRADGCRVVKMWVFKD